MKAHVGILAAAVLLVLAASPAYAKDMCRPGSDGPGGRYDPERARCVDGRIMPNGQEWCPAGRNGPGGFYISSGAHCVDGVPLRWGDGWCGRGPYSEAEARCVNGKLIPNKDTCAVGPYGPGGPYDKFASHCVEGKVLPLSQMWCPRGPGGPGGPYVKARSRCVAGRIVPN